jgi:hypothetical protein
MKRIWKFSGVRVETLGGCLHTTSKALSGKKDFDIQNDSLSPVNNMTMSKKN